MVQSVVAERPSPRRVEAGHAAEQVDPDGRQPEPAPGRPGDDPAGDRERTADHAPGQDALEVLPQRPVPERHQREHAPAYLGDGIADADDQPARAERLRDRGPHHQRDQEQGYQ